MDTVSKQKRSEIMSKIHSSNTKFERKFVVALKRLTEKKFQTNVVSIKGKPDIVFQKDKICLFLDSDFWHGWQYPRWKRLLKNDFWHKKIENNRKRDKKTTAYLRRNGWKVLRIWEHTIQKTPDNVIKKTVAFLKSRRFYKGNGKSL